MNRWHSCIAIASCTVLLAWSCGRKPETNREPALARVHNAYLYPSDLRENFPAGLAMEDSLKVQRRLVDSWVRNQLLLRQAETYLPEEEKDVKRQVEEYRISLLIFKYKQYLVYRNIDSIVTEEEIAGYYQENTENFILNSDVVKVNYVKAPVGAPQLNQVSLWYRSEDPAHNVLLKGWCEEFADSYIIGGEEWIRFNDLLARIPFNPENPGRYLNYNRNIEVSDSLFQYYIHIIDRIPEGNPSPIELVKQNIISVILNKRKLEYIQDLENTVYKDGLSRKQVEIF